MDNKAMIQAIEQNLRVGMRLLNALNSEQYCDSSVRPYHSSVGSHIRHILDIFDCVFCGLPSGQIDLTARSRNLDVETQISAGLSYFEDILQKLETVQHMDMEQRIAVTDDLGMGCVTVQYTVAAVFIQAHSHAIHHFASLGYVLTDLGIELPHIDFGLNPTTPRSAA